MNCIYPRRKCSFKEAPVPEEFFEAVARSKKLAEIADKLLEYVDSVSEEATAEVRAMKLGQ